jgi:peptidoglycan/xylan/chitin deacetylase (PgdA/CDA1 family)
MPLEQPHWPNGARCAVMLSFDNFGESFDLLRYGHAGGALADGVYAPRRGIPRVLDLLERHGLPATFFLEGWNVGKYTGLAREIVERGHEVAGHGWMHEQWNTLSPEVEGDLIARTTNAITEATGMAPRGWRAPSGLTTTATLELLHAAGYVYDSSFADDDLPYLLTTAPESPDTLVELPWQWSLDDAAYFAYPGAIRRPADVFELWRDEFDAAYAQTGYFALVCHPRYIGRPARIDALERLVEHVQSHDGVWFARCEEIAAATRAWPEATRYPAPARLEP